MARPTVGGGAGRAVAQGVAVSQEFEVRTHGPVQCPSRGVEPD
jgi:hypothetical protein